MYDWTKNWVITLGVCVCVQVCVCVCVRACVRAGVRACVRASEIKKFRSSTSSSHCTCWSSHVCGQFL